MKKKEVIEYAMIDPIGGHGGIHLYCLPLCKAISKEGKVIYYTTDETPSDLSVPFPVKRLFRNIYTPRYKLQKALNYELGLMKMASDIFRTRPKILHIQCFGPTFLDLMFICLLRRFMPSLRIVGTIHDVTPFEYYYQSPKAIAKVYRSLDGCVVHTREDKSKLVKAYGVNENLVHIIRHGNFLDNGENQGGPFVAEGPVRFLFFGQIRPEKGLAELIAAFGILKERGHNFRAVIAGRCRSGFSSTHTTYESQIRDLGLSKLVVFENRFVPDKDVHLYFSACHVVVLPYTQISQSGVALLAFSRARPILASKIGCFQEMVIEGQTGWFCRPNDVESLADALEKTLNITLEKIKTMGMKAREFVETNYSWEKIGVDTVHFYREVMS